MPGRTYSDDEVREILRRAVEQSASAEGNGEGLTREELIEAARDVGIDASAVQAAIGVVEREREVDVEALALHKGDRKRLVSSFSTWAIVAAGLLLMHLLGAGGWWFMWPMGVWLVFLLLRLKSFLLESADKLRERAEQSIQHRRRHQKRRSGHVDHRRPLDAAQSVERGVEDLLGAAARRARGGEASRVRAPQTPEESDGAADTSAEEGSAEPAARGRSRS